MFLQLHLPECCSHQSLMLFPQMCHSSDSFKNNSWIHLLVPKGTCWGGLTSIGSSAPSQRALSFLSGTGGEDGMKNLMDRGKDRKVAHQLVSRVKQTLHRETAGIYPQLQTDESREGWRPTKTTSLILRLLPPPCSRERGCSQSPQHGSPPALLHMGSLPEPLLHGLPTAHSSLSADWCGPAPQGLSVRSQRPQHSSPQASCSCMGSSMGHGVGICSAWCPGAAGLSLLHHGPAAPAPWAPPARLPHQLRGPQVVFLTPLPAAVTLPFFFFLTLLNLLSQKLSQHISRLSSGQQCVLHESSCDWPSSDTGQLLVTTKGHSYSFPAIKTLACKLTSHRHSPISNGWFSHLTVGTAPAIQHCQKEPNTVQWLQQLFFSYFFSFFRIHKHIYPFIAHRTAVQSSPRLYFNETRKTKQPCSQLERALLLDSTCISSQSSRGKRSATGWQYEYGWAKFK